jgi:hypothetical protein
MAGAAAAHAIELDAGSHVYDLRETGNTTASVQGSSLGAVCGIIEWLDAPCDELADLVRTIMSVFTSHRLACDQRYDAWRTLVQCLGHWTHPSIGYALCLRPTHYTEQQFATRFCGPCCAHPLHYLHACSTTHRISYRSNIQNWYRTPRV